MKPKKQSLMETLKPAAAATAAPSTVFSILDATDVTNAQTVFAGLNTATSAAHDLGMALYQKGVHVDALTKATDTKPNPHYNNALWIEIVQAIVRSPKFGQRGRECIQRKLAGLDPIDADDSSLRTLEMRKVNQCLKLIKSALANAHSSGGKDTRKPLTLHEQLDQWAKSALDAIAAKRDKAGLTQQQGDELLAAWRTVRSATSTVFKAAK